MEKKMPNRFVIIGVIVLIVLWAIYQYINPFKGGQNMDDQLNQMTPSPSSNASTKVTPSSGVPAANLSYNQALALYKDKRLQFDDNCLMVPNYVTFKKGTTIMLDNRSSKPRTIGLDGVKHSLSAFGFKVITITTSAPLPHTTLVDCGSGQNNGTIIIQQ